jgi:hypothetical protein
MDIIAALVELLFITVPIAVFSWLNKSTRRESN